MLNWLFKKKTPTTAVPAPVTPPPAPSVVDTAARDAEAAAWSARLDAARGEDAALLALAREAPSVDIKLAAVEALADEASLKSAEKEFRTHDRRVYRAAKQRLAAAVARREAREAAQRLIESAEALQAADLIPANRLVALDRDWQALDASLVEPAQATRFAALRDTLTALMRERAEREAAIARWTAASRQALAHLHTVSLAVAQGVEDRTHLAQAVEAVESLEAALPAGHDDAVLTGELHAARLVAAQIDARLSLLAGFEAAAVASAQAAAQAASAAGRTTAASTGASPAPAAEADGADDTGSAPEADRMADAAQAGVDMAASTPSASATLPDGEPGDGPVHAAAPVPGHDGDSERPHGAAPTVQPFDLAAPTAQWQAMPPIDAQAVARALEQRWQTWLRAHAAPTRVATPKADKRAERPARARPAAPDAAAVAQAEAVLLQAETALADGHLAVAHQHLTALDALALPGQRGRVQALWAEHARLKGWQQWGGARAREDLVEEAEALAAATLAPDARIVARQQAAAIDALRKRWKELDRLGGPSSQPLWLRFDAALTTAHGPVAAEQARVDAERRANLEAREALLSSLEATPSPEATGWREQARALETFRAAWRKLGPPEHTVPHKSRDALLARWRAVVDRIEAPLEAARREAEAAREVFIQRARDLVAEGASGLGRDVVAKVRDLQAQWQEHAKGLPLSRGAENALWARFKAETDAVFAQREAAFSARDSELRVNQLAREALIERLQALPADAPASELKRTLAEVDAEWRRAGEVPRAEVQRLETACRDAREQVQSHLSSSAQRSWHAALDVLLARRTLCERREREGESPSLLAAWPAHPALLPARWDAALQQRFDRGPAADVAAASINGWLLQLEMALDMPSPEAHQGERRELKLRAMKMALESRQTATADLLDVDAAVARLLPIAALDTSQRARFDAVLDVLRRRPAGSLRATALAA